jgi:hypothetical protein
LVSLYVGKFQGTLKRDLKGNLVRIQDGPAAVNGDETPQKPLEAFQKKIFWEGRGSRMIRESEDLPRSLNLCRSVEGQAGASLNWG